MTSGDGARTYLSARLQVGDVYSRNQLGEMLGVAGSAMGSGVFRRKGTNSVLLFVTARKSADRTQYADRLDGDILHWEGPEKRGPDQMVIDHGTRGLELLLFYRERKNEFPAYGFRYEGPFDYLSHRTPDGDGPTSFVLSRSGTMEDGPADADGSDAPADVDRDIADLRADATLPETTRKALIDARRGQGRFRKALMRRWSGACAVLGITTKQVLRASHAKPWRDSTNDERLDPANGLLLAAHLDALFDAGLISFADDGTMLVSGQVPPSDRAALGLPRRLRLRLSQREREFMALHRKATFRT